VKYPSNYKPKPPFIQKSHALHITVSLSAAVSTLFKLKLCIVQPVVLRRSTAVTAPFLPERVKGLVSAGGYSIQDIAGSSKPAEPEEEFRIWYQFYFHTKRGQLGFEKHRVEFCKLLWNLWSPNWEFTDNQYEQTAKSFKNPDFAEVIIHSYRHRFGLEKGDPIYEDLESQLVAQPSITVPTVVIDCEGDGVMPPSSLEFHHQFFTKIQQHIILPSIGHNLPQEAPREFAHAVMSLL